MNKFSITVLDFSLCGLIGSLLGYFLGPLAKTSLSWVLLIALAGLSGIITSYIFRKHIKPHLLRKE